MALIAVINCHFIHKPKFQSGKEFNQKKIKLVHYAFKNGDSIEIKSVVAKILEIEPYDNWVARAVFDGDNYNTTGYTQ